MNTTESAATARLPRTVWVIMTAYERSIDKVRPLFIPFPPIGFGMPIFGDKELAEDFIASPGFDMPAVPKEVPLETIIRTGEEPIAIVREHGDESEYFFMIDPRPWHEWESADDMGAMYSMQDVARVLREELGD